MEIETTTCPHCKKEIPADSLTCPFCQFGIEAWEEGVIDANDDLIADAEKGKKPAVNYLLKNQRLCFSASVLFFIIALIHFFTGSHGLSLLWLCLGAMYMAFGIFEKKKTGNAEKVEMAEGD